MVIYAGAPVRAADIPSLRVVVKTVAETVTSSTTLQDDDELVVDLPAGRTYLIRAWLHVSGDPGGDVQTAWVLTGGAAVTRRTTLGPPLSTADIQNSNWKSGVQAMSATVQYGTDGTNISLIQECFLVETVSTGTDATLQLRWSQATSSATATRMREHSHIEVIEVERT